MPNSIINLKDDRSVLQINLSVRPWASKKRIKFLSNECLHHYITFLRNNLKLKSHLYLVNLVICGKKRGQTLNLQHRNKNRPTDVLSFPMEEGLYLEKKLPDYLTQQLNLGDIVICHDVMLQQAYRFETTIDEEFIRLFIHGLLHLTDMDHERGGEEEKMMFRFQEQLIEKVLRSCKL